MGLADGSAWEAHYGYETNSAIDYRKLKAIERIKYLLEGLENGNLQVIDVQYFQTLDNKNGISIITEYQDGIKRR